MSLSTPNWSVIFQCVGYAMDPKEVYDVIINICKKLSLKIQTQLLKTAEGMTTIGLSLAGILIGAYFGKHVLNVLTGAYIGNQIVNAVCETKFIKQDLAIFIEDLCEKQKNQLVEHFDTFIKSCAEKVKEIGFEEYLIPQFILLMKIFIEKNFQNCKIFRAQQSDFFCKL